MIFSMALFLLLCANVKATPPTWNPVQNQQYNMQVIGQIQISAGNFSTNPLDIVGAFYGTECRGIASPIFGSVLFLTITSNSAASPGELITFKVYRNSTDMVYDCPETMNFQVNGAIGTIPSPFNFTFGCTNPSAYLVNGGGAYCSSPLNVYLEGSQTGVTYTLYKDGVSTGLSQAGAGTALFFTGLTLPGVYTIIGVNGVCQTTMTGSATITAAGLPNQPGTIAGPVTPCYGYSVTYSAAPVSGATSYTWTLPGGWSGSSTSNSITVTVGSTSGNVCVTANNTCGSSVQRCLAVTIAVAPTQPGTISGNANPCQGSTQTYSIAAVSGATSYTWSIPSGWTGVSTTTSISVTVGSTGGNLSVTANNSCGAGTARTISLTVSALPTNPGSVTGGASVCQGSSQNYSVLPVANATSYTWTLPSGWSGSSTTNSIVTTIGTSGGNICVVANNACGSSAQNSCQNVSVSNVPTQPGTMTGTASPCQGIAQTYSVATVAGASSYTWAMPSGWTGSSTTNTITVTPTATSGTVCVTAVNSCGSSTARCMSVLPVTVPAQPGAISGTFTVCQGTSQTYSVTSVAGATSYTWTFPSGWTGTSTTNSIAVTPSASSGIISVVANNACGSGPARTANVAVNTLPAQPGSISGNNSVCQGNSLVLNVSTVIGATSYTWTVPSGWSCSSTTNSISCMAVSPGGTFSVVANNACGSSSPSSIIVTVGSTPAQPGTISGATAVCAGSTVTYSVSAVSGATSYAWTLPSGWVGSSTTNSISVTAGSTGGVISVSAINSCGTSTARTLNVTINPLPSAAGLPSGPTSVTVGNSYTYTVAAIANATSYNWTYSGTGASFSSTTSSVTITFNTGATSGTLNVYGVNSCGNGLPSNGLPITVTSQGNISGVITYFNSASTPMQNVVVSLKNSGGTVIATSTTSASGAYSFTSVASGSYTLQCSTTKAWGGATSIDITLFKNHIAAITLLTGIKLNSGDVNNSGAVSSIDLTLIKNRIAAISTSFVAGDWLFDNTPITMSGANVVQNFKALCYGDANGSFIPVNP